MKSLSIQTNRELGTKSALQKSLLLCGILSTLWYAIINVIVPLQYPGYNVTSQTVSELSAIDAPTRSLWMTLCIPFSLLLIAFGIGVWLQAGYNNKLRYAAGIIIFDAILGFFWAPMNKREVIAAGDGTLSDILHLVWAFLHLALMLLMIGYGAAALGKRFRIYSILTVLTFVVFGILTTLESQGIETGEPTPYIGVWERINMGAYMLWVVVFATVLLKKKY